MLFDALTHRISTLFEVHLLQKIPLEYKKVLFEKYQSKWIKRWIKLKKRKNAEKKNPQEKELKIRTK